MAHDVLDNGICVDCRSVEAARFNPQEPREPHSGKWVKTPGGGQSAADSFKKFMSHLEDGNDAGALSEAEKIDPDGFGSLTPRQQHNLQFELESIADGKVVDPEHRARAQAVLEKLGLRGPKKGGRKPAATTPKAPEAPTPKPALPTVLPTAQPKAPPRVHSKTSGFDSANAARDLDALDAAPSRNRTLYEAGLTPAERRKFLAEVDAMPDREARDYGGRGPKSTLAADEHLSIEERDRLSAAADEYMQKAYIPINKSLYTGVKGDEQTQQWIDDLDKLISLSRVEQDSYLHRGTVLPEDLPDEMTLSGFTSLTHSDAVAASFVTGKRGDEAGGRDRKGVPTVMTFRVPKGTQAMQFSPQDVLGEVLLHRGAKVRRVPDDPGVETYLQFEGIRYVTYEVIG